MKHLLAALFILISLTSLAQPKLDVRGGFTYSTYNGKNQIIVNDASQPGFYAGLNLEIPLTKKFSLDNSFTYSRRGSWTPGVANTNPDAIHPDVQRVNFYVDYAVLNTSIQYNPSFRWSFGVGGYVSQIVMVKTTRWNYTAYRWPNNWHFMNRYDAGLTAHAVYNFHGALSLQAKYSHGMEDVGITGDVNMDHLQNRNLEAGIIIRLRGWNSN